MADEKGEPLGKGRSQHSTGRLSGAVELLRGIRDGTFSNAECGTWETFDGAGSRATNTAGGQFVAQYPARGPE
jgi:hypothetical protein